MTKNIQAEIQRRKKLGRPAACQSPLSTKLVCGDCGGFYGSKVWGSNTKYRRVIWRCNDKYRGDSKCSTPHVTEEEVKKKFLEAFNSLLEYREELISNCRLSQTVLCDYSDLASELDDLYRELEVVAELSRKAIYENAHIAINQSEWQERNNGYLERHQKATERIAELEDRKREKQSKNRMIESFIRNLESCDILKEFDECLWIAAIDKVVVNPDAGLTFHFKDGTNYAK